MTFYIFLHFSCLRHLERLIFFYTAVVCVYVCVCVCVCVKASGYTRRLRVARAALCIDGDTPGASVPSCELYVCSLQGRSSAKAHRAASRVRKRRVKKRLVTLEREPTRARDRRRRYTDTLEGAICDSLSRSSAILFFGAFFFFSNYHHPVT